MAVQATSTVVDLQVSAAADLTTLQDVRMSDGYRAWVTVSGASHGLWVLDQTSALPADGVTVVATFSGVGRWILFGAGGSGAAANISVVNEAALTALPVAAFNDGALAYVQSHRSYWTLRTQAVALLAHEIIASSAGARQWNRAIEIPHITWALSTVYNIDATNGNDENDGTTNPLQTYAEYIRRCPYLYISQTVNILTTLPDSDNLVHSQEQRWHQSLSATRPILTIVGTRTFGAQQVVATSTDEVGNAAPTLDVGVALTPGTLVQSIDGASINSTAVVLVLIAGTNYRTTPWSDNGGTPVRVAPPAAGTHVSAVTLPTVNAISVVQFGSAGASSGHPVFQNLNIKDAWGTMPSALFNRCVFLGATGNCIPGGGGAWIYFGSCISSTQFFTGFSTAQRTAIFRQCGIIRANATIFFAISCIEFTNTVIQGGQLDVSNARAQGPASLQISSLGIFGINAGTALKVERGAYIDVVGTLYGADPGGASVGTDVREGGHISVLSTVTPTLTAATELIVEGAGTAIPALAAGAAVPAASALATWAAWVAAPFTRNVMDYKTGTTISNHL